MANLNYVGKKIFAVNKIDDEDMIYSLMNKAKSITSIKTFSE